MLWAILCIDNPDTDAIRDRLRAVHREHLDSYGKGLFFSGPPLADDNEDEQIGSLFVMNAGSRQEAQDLHRPRTVSTRAACSPAVNDRGTQHYYLGARSNTDNTGKIVPVLGAIDAKTNAFDANTPTSTTAHSVAADLHSHHIFVPMGFVPPGSPAGTDATNPCPTTGCIAVYLPSAGDDDHGTKMARR